MIDKLVTYECYDWQKEPEFQLGQPVWVHGDAETTWIVIGRFKAMWSEWYVAAVPENHLDAQPSNIPCSWLTSHMPGEPRYRNVIHVNFRKR